MDIAREQDIECLRRLAFVQKRQIELLLEQLAKKSSTIDQLLRKEGDLQQTLGLIEEALRNETQGDKSEARTDELDATDASSADKEDGDESSSKPPRKGHGPNPQNNLSRRQETFDLDEPDKICAASVARPCFGSPGMRHSRLVFT